MEIQAGIGISSYRTSAPERITEASGREAARARIGEQLSATGADEDPAALSQDEQRMLQALRERDREVRAHEAAHVAAGGQYVSGGPSYSYQKGPDGRQYAIGGEVQIDTSKISSDPEAMLEKASTMLRAALAPAEPSAQDLRVAANARSMEIDARAELAALEQSKREQETQNSAPGKAAIDNDDGEDDPAIEQAGAMKSTDRARGNDATNTKAEHSAQATLEQRITNFFRTSAGGRIDQYA